MGSGQNIRPWLIALASTLPAILLYLVERLPPDVVRHSINLHGTWRTTVADGPHLASPEHDDSGWSTYTSPGRIGEFSPRAVRWLRRRVVLSQELTNRDLFILHYDELTHRLAYFVNGEQVCVVEGTSSSPKVPQYGLHGCAVPRRVLQGREALIAIRMDAYWEVDHGLLASEFLLGPRSLLEPAYLRWRALAHGAHAALCACMIGLALILSRLYFVTQEVLRRRLTRATAGLLVFSALWLDAARGRTLAHLLPWESLFFLIQFASMGGISWFLICTCELYFLGRVSWFGQVNRWVSGGYVLTTVALAAGGDPLQIARPYYSFFAVWLLGGLSGALTVASVGVRRRREVLGPVLFGAVVMINLSGLNDLLHDLGFTEGAYWFHISMANVTLVAGGLVLMQFAHIAQRNQQLAFSLTESNARLESALGQATLASDAATEAIRAREDFLSIASHELKTPLTSLKLELDLLRRWSQQDLSAQDQHAMEARLSKVQRSVDRLGALIRNLLDVSRLVSGQLVMSPEPVDLASVVRETVARNQEVLVRAGTPLSLSVPQSLIGSWDQMRLEQILDNLLSNAAKYGVGRPIEITLTAREGQAVLQVTDNGIGIAQEDQKRIFERFERAVSGRHFGGFGLGLWIVRQIVEAMGGQISVVSRLGAGAKFTVTLPVKHTDAQMKASVPNLTG